MPARRAERKCAARIALAMLCACAASTVSAQTQYEYFQRVDRDSDGFVSPLEFQDWMSRAFHRMDSNRDGVLEPHEQLIPNARQITLDALHQRLARQFTKQDVDHDGRLSAREYLAPAQ